MFITNKDFRNTLIINNIGDRWDTNPFFPSDRLEMIESYLELNLVLHQRINNHTIGSVVWIIDTTSNNPGEKTNENIFLFD